MGLGTLDPAAGAAVVARAQTPGVSMNKALSPRVLVCCAVVLTLVLAGAATIAPPAGATGFVQVGQLFGVNASDAVNPDDTHVHQQRIAVEHATGNILATNTVTDQIDVYAPALLGGALLTSFGAGQLTNPFGIAIDQNSGAIYVSDPGGNRIVRYTVTPGAPPTYTLDADFAANGPVLGTGTGEIGDFAAPLAIDQSAGKLLVADPGNNRVERFTLAGGYDGLSFDGADSAGDPAGYAFAGAFAGLLDIAVDSTGDIMVVDANGDIADGAGESRVLRFSSTGVYERRIGASLSRPATVGIRPVNDEVFVSWNQDAVYNDVPRLDSFTDDGTAIGSVQLPPQNAPSGTMWSLVTGVALDDGADGRLYVGSDADRSQYNGSYGLWSIQALAPYGSPEVADERATKLTPTTATVSATLFTNAAATTYHFEYGVVGQGLTNSTPSTVLPPLYPPGIFRKLTGLQPDTEYQFRLVADNGLGPVMTSVGGTFRTALALAMATVGSATEVTTDAATVHADVDTRGYAATYRFTVAEVGGAQRVSVPSAALPASTPHAEVSAHLTGLMPGKTYAVRLHVNTAAGTTIADQVTFTTVAKVYVPPPPPAEDLDPNGCGVASLALVSCGGAAGPTPSRTPDNRVTVTKVTVKGTTARILVRTPGPGTLTISGNHGTQARVTVKEAGTTAISFRLSKAGAKALAKAKAMRLTVQARVRFAPAGGTAASVTRAITFKRDTRR